MFTNAIKRDGRSKQAITTADSLFMDEPMDQHSRLGWLLPPGFRVVSQMRRCWVDEANPVYGPLMQRLGHVLRSRRREAGYSQEAFADKIGMHRAYYSAIERGEKNLQLDTLQRVCDGLSAQLWEVLRDADA